MKEEEISYKDLKNSQLENLKEIYIDSRIQAMSEEDLRKFTREVLDIQIKGTVGNEEEREVWKEMKTHFKESFEEKIKEVLKVKGSEEEEISPEQKELQKRLELVEKRKKEKEAEVQDMWEDD